jgi:hypothetical protein
LLYFSRSRREYRRDSNAEISERLWGKRHDLPESVRRSIYLLAHQLRLAPASARTDVPAFLSHVMYVGTQCGFNELPVSQQQVIISHIRRLKTVLSSNLYLGLRSPTYLLLLQALRAPRLRSRQTTRRSDEHRTRCINHSSFTFSP